jgi:hypothetical protein
MKPKKIKTVSDVRKELIRLKKAYAKIVKSFEKNGICNLDLEETEYYGAYLGKVELCEDLLQTLKS